MSDKATDAMQQFRVARPSSAALSPALVLLYADNFEQLPPAWPLPTSKTTIGSGEQAQLRLPVSALSRLHAEIGRDGGGWYLRDLGSTNGSYVEGQRITLARLEHGQELRMGDAVLKFAEDGYEQYRHYPLNDSSTADTALVGGAQMRRLAQQLEQIAATSLSVLLLGESGTGKEVAARHLHDASGRSGPFQAVNCAALPANLIESELFGFKKGAFSGAEKDKAGLIRSAHGGTLLLDEIGDMPLVAQAKLLRVLANHEVLPLGASKAEAVDVRVVAATHQNLVHLQEAGRFRQDLFARLNQFSVTLPPLRDRKEDIYRLVQAFARRQGQPQAQLDFPTMLALINYDWPYNVRELEGCVRRCLALSGTASIEARTLPSEIQEAMASYGKSAPSDIASAGGVPERDQLIQRLRLHRGNVAAVARDLGKARMQVHRWLKRHGLNIDDFRTESDEPVP